MPPDTTLTDGVVALRQWRPDDAEWYVEHSRDPEIQRWTTEPPDLTVAAARTAIERALADRLVAYAIADAGTGELLGNLALSPAHELSYWVVPAARGRGVATRAVRLLLARAWSAGVDRVVLHAHVDNVGSQRVAERAGFRRDRVERAARQVKGETWDVVWYVLDRP
ncbi:MAG TPA: GNAT family protein [Actinoplanes sp.]|nr:GNAT family protein [Actinoplanes sp.]